MSAEYTGRFVFCGQSAAPFTSIVSGNCCVSVLESSPLDGQSVFHGELLCRT